MSAIPETVKTEINFMNSQYKTEQRAPAYVNYSTNLQVVIDEQGLKSEAIG